MSVSSPPLNPATLTESRRLVKCSWRIAAQHRGVAADLEGLVRSSRQVRFAFYLSDAQHRACCLAAIEQGEQWLALRLEELERATGTLAPRERA